MRVPTEMSAASNDASRGRLWRGAVVLLLVTGVLFVVLAGRDVLTLERVGRTPTTVRQAPAVPADDGLTDYDAGRAPFAVEVGREVIPYRRMLLQVMPGESVALRAVSIDAAPTPVSVRVEADAGVAAPAGSHRWTWRAPDRTGLVRVRVLNSQGGILLNVFVMRPYHIADGVLRGYRIGRYERGAYRGNPLYEAPRGFIEVTPDMTDTPVSPHFTLGQFLCKQGGGFPKYLRLHPRLVMKLERLQEALRRAGAPARLHVMSGFRTPFYNRSIGNTTTYSAHLYGLAADVFVDEDADGYMDDITGDGRASRADALRLLEIAETVPSFAGDEALRGGLGVYGAASHRGPFVHVDVRGTSVRW